MELIILIGNIYSTKSNLSSKNLNNLHNFNEKDKFINLFKRK